MSIGRLALVSTRKPSVRPIPGVAMRYTLFVNNIFQHLQLLLLVLLLGACAAPPVEEPQPTAEIVAPELPAEIAKPAPVQVPVEVPVEVIVQQPDHVAIILSADIPAFRLVAQKLSKQIGAENVSIHILESQADNATTVLANIAMLEADQIVAIGLPAAKVAQQVVGLPVVFCQTFNYQDYDLVADSSKGVSMLPSFAEQFAVWRELVPELERVGVVARPEHAKLVAEISAAAAVHDITIVSSTATSDKETLLEFRRLSPDVQGLILLPDNRILSPRVLREIMAYGAKRRTQIVVYGAGMLQLGAFISFTVPDDSIAAAVLARLNAANSDGNISGPAVTVADGLRFAINPAIAQHLGIAAPRLLVQVRDAN
jgi:ABC-type uncharacterized transport system substrate-binding protein